MELNLRIILQARPTSIVPSAAGLNTTTLSGSSRIICSSICHESATQSSSCGSMAALMWPVCAQERKTATLTRFADQVWRSVCDPILNEQAFEYPKGFPLIWWLIHELAMPVSYQEMSFSCREAARYLEGIRHLGEREK